MEWAGHSGKGWCGEREGITEKRAAEGGRERHACLEAVQALTRVYPFTRSASPEPLSTLLYSLAAVGYQPSPAWMASFFLITQPWLQRPGPGASGGSGGGGGRGFNGRALSRMLWALATLRHAPPPAWLAL